MKVDKLNIKNFKAVKRVSIRADKNLILIDGKNGAGKSSVLDAILAALGGKKAICEEPLRRGESNGYVEAEVGDFKIVRTFRPDGKTSIKIQGKDGGKFGQERLNRMFSSIGPDPVAFLNSKPADQVKTAKDVLGIDFTELDERRKSLFDDRTDKNRDVKRLESQLEGLEFFEDAPDEEVSVSAALKELQAAQDHNKVGDDLDAELTRVAAEVVAQDQIVERLRHQLTEAERTLAKMIEDQQAAQDKVDHFELMPTEQLEQTLNSAEETNSKVRANAKRAEVEGELAAAQEESKKLSDQIHRIDEEKSRQIQEAKFPVKGLSIGDGGLLFNDLPFDQASSAQRIRVSVAMSLAMNPELRVLMIRDGSLLDEDSLAMVADLAEEMDAQIWVERVGEDDEGAFIIVDGEVAQKQTA